MRDSTPTEDLEEFHVLQTTPDGWFTAVHEGEPMTFRVLEDDGLTPTDATAYISSRVNDSRRLLQSSMAVEAAEQAYRSVYVQVSLLEDLGAIPETDEDTAVDLWMPLHVALMTRNTTAVQALLQFHLERAFDAMACFTSALTVPSVVPNDVEDPSLVEVQRPPDTEQTAANTTGSTQGVALPGQSLSPSKLRQPEQQHQQQRLIPVMECQARRELGGTVVLLGCFDAGRRITIPPLTRKSRPPSPQRTPANASLISNGPPVVSGSHAALAAMEDNALQHLQQQNELLTAKADDLLKDKGEEYCLYNIMTALRTLLQSAIYDLKRNHRMTEPRQTYVMELVRSFCSSVRGLPHHPPLLVDSAAMYSLCNEGQLSLLHEVLEAFEGCLAPILRGQALLIDRSSTAQPGFLSTASSPTMAPLRCTSSSHSCGAGTPRGRTSSLNCGRHSTASTPFWLSCSPQQIHHIAFYASWIGFREAVEDCPGSARRRRAVDIVNENRAAIATLRQLQECRVTAPQLEVSVWSGHLYIITKLLSHDCSVEDFMDYVEEGGYRATYSSSRGFPGVFISVLVAGVQAAAAVRDPGMLRVLGHKVETLLPDVPGRSLQLHTFVLGRPATHAERFRELWLDNATPNATARKFRTRVELLYSTVVDQVLTAAEVAWSDTPLGAASCEFSKAEAQTALYGWLAMWRNFFSSLRDRPGHRRSLSHSSASSTHGSQQHQSVVPIPQPPATQQHHVNPNLLGTTTPLKMAEGSPSVAVIPPSPSPLLQPSVPPWAVSNEDMLSDDGSENSDAISRVSRAFHDRLESGRDPLPALRQLLFPHGVTNADVLPSANTTLYVEKALPVSSIDQEFMEAQKAFGANAEKEATEVKLQFYGLFKQATIGDVNVPRPGIFDFVGRAKWDAWAKMRGMSFLDAKRKYVSEYEMMRELRKEKK